MMVYGKNNAVKAWKVVLNGLKFIKIGRVLVTLPTIFYSGNPSVTYPNWGGGLESRQSGEKSSKIDGVARES